MPYIGQKISMVAKNKKRDKQLPISTIQQTLEQCKTGKRVIIYGEAGSGKTTALHNIASWWLERRVAVLQSYKFLFLIPLRLVQSHSIIDIICEDCQLLPAELGESLSRLLVMNQNQVLFLLDSYEEVAVRGAVELNNLITGELYAQATVLITSRPGSQLTYMNPHSDITAQLENLSEKDVKDYIACYSKRSQEMCSDIKGKFGMHFLSRPINLALACCLYKKVGSKGIHQVSQTGLFSQFVLQFIMIYIEHVHHVRGISFENVLDFFRVDDGRFSLAGAKTAVLEICRLCYQASRERRVGFSTVDTSLTVKDLMNSGLFFHRPDSDSVHLLHYLFQEFLAAVYLVSGNGKEAWKLLFTEIQKSQDSPPRLNLEDILRDMGLENVIKFVVGLSPNHGEQLCRLFVIKQQKINNFNFRPVSLCIWPGTVTGMYWWWCEVSHGLSIVRCTCDYSASWKCLHTKQRRWSAPGHAHGHAHLHRWTAGSSVSC